MRTLPQIQVIEGPCCECELLILIQPQKKIKTHYEMEH